MQDIHKYNIYGYLLYMHAHVYVHIQLIYRYNIQYIYIHTPLHSYIYSYIYLHIDVRAIHFERKINGAFGENAIYRAIDTLR